MLFKNAKGPERGRTAGEVAAGIYIGGIAALAGATGVPYILFPELGALAHDVLTRPRGTWAKAPLLLVATPVLTALVGTLIARTMAYGVPSILLTIASAIVVIRLLRSPIAPAISAGLLPLTLGVTSWLYPPAILLGTGLLAGLVLLRRRFAPMPPEPVSATDRLDDLVEMPPAEYSWIPFFLAFLAFDGVLAVTTGWRFLLYPPLVVIGFEMFAHSAICPWSDRPLALPIACAASGAVGTAIVTLAGTGPIAVMVSMAGGIVILRLFRLHVPPALAVGLLPFVIDHVDARFPVAVGISTALLAGTFLLWRRVSSELRANEISE